MRVNTKEKNPALEILLRDMTQAIFLDANFLISPDRTRMGGRPIAFQKYAEIWLDSIFDAFPNLAVHEAVYEELIDENVRTYADAQRNKVPTRLKVYYDRDLSETERMLMQTYTERLAEFSQYSPSQDNAKDRGEVKSLSYMAVKGFLYFAANDNLPINLIRNAGKLHTGLDSLYLLEMYDIIFCLYKMGKYDNKGLRLLYKYQYYLTEKEKTQNPEWREFIERMNLLYPDHKG